ncbi:MAG TPA: heme-copper oxidase subunit III [Candidatus Polarisedimenticolia bacterium]|nr:heme-copper oxidase subunit III [Candidatus Polarisedimenticolia bacterium]
MPRQAARPREGSSPSPRFGGGSGAPPRPPAVTNARVAIVMLIAAETMFFTGLLGAYVVLRGTAVAWPPPGQPRLPLAVTWANTAVLALSCWTMTRAWRALHRKDARLLVVSLTQTAVLGSAFLAVQGTEWVRLIGHGLTLTASLYGATFYTLIGVHGLHVAAAVAWLVAAAALSRGSRFTLRRAASVDVCAIYWYFVCGLWAVLFPLVYLS